MKVRVHCILNWGWLARKLKHLSVRHSLRSLEELLVLEEQDADPKSVPWQQLELLDCSFNYIPKMEVCLVYFFFF